MHISMSIRNNGIFSDSNKIAKHFCKLIGVSSNEKSETRYMNVCLLEYIYIYIYIYIHLTGMYCLVDSAWEATVATCSAYFARLFQSKIQQPQTNKDRKNQYAWLYAVFVVLFCSA